MYRLLNNAGLCSYYDLNEYAGKNLRQKNRQNQFAYLDETNIKNSLINFRQDGQVHVTFLIPFIHCSSCVYLLENLHRIEQGVTRVDIQFLKKEASIIFNEAEITLRQVVERLADIGYEPHISLNSADKKQSITDRTLIFRLGVAGFCFGNIMLLSFPEYFGYHAQGDDFLKNIFRYLNVVLALPVFFYSAAVFFTSAWKGLRHRHLNIDFPVALAILVTFIRSLVEVFSGAGGGYFDSMTGIVFFMLAGRVLQDRTYAQLSFERNYTDYFPMAATIVDSDGMEKPTPLPQIKAGDTLRIYNGELIPADGILVKGNAEIDYSFVTGESLSVKKEMGEILYAGGRQMAGPIELLTIKEVAQSYLTGLWHKEPYSEERNSSAGGNSFVHGLAKNFTFLVLAIALFSGIYWYMHDATKIWPSVTAVLIIACPCGLLLTATFARGHIMRILGKNGFFVKNAFVIEKFGEIEHLVFDKTGTLTSAANMEVSYHGASLSSLEKIRIASLTIPAYHSLGKAIKNYLSVDQLFPVNNFQYFEGMGVEGEIDGHFYQIGTSSFIHPPIISEIEKGTRLFIKEDGIYLGYFELRQGFRPGIRSMISRLSKRVSLSMLSGDEPHQKGLLSELIPAEGLRFKQMPEDKLNYIQSLKASGIKVAMAGDGLNDAGAMKESDVGICIAEDTNQFTPASDAIIDGKQLHLFDKLMTFCRQEKNIIKICFGFSVIYNVIGIYFAVQASLSPLLAAIIMPCSTLTIIFLTWLLSHIAATKLR